VPGPSARGTADMAGAARDEETTGSTGRTDALTGRGEGGVEVIWKDALLPLKPSFTITWENDPCSRKDCKRAQARMKMPPSDWPLANLCSFFLHFCRYRTIQIV
jgi:hypothetical protein